MKCVIGGDNYGQAVVKLLSSPPKTDKTMKERIRALVEDAAPLANVDADFLFAELDSLGVTAILMTLASEYGIELEASDATPRNFKNLDSIVAMVEKKLREKQ